MWGFERLKVVVVAAVWSMSACPYKITTMLQNIWQDSEPCNCVTSNCFKKKRAVKESMWLIHTFIHYHVQIVFRWYKAVVRLQCSPSCCLYCSKKRKYQHDQESRGTLANINYVLRRQADISSNVKWGEKSAQKCQWVASALIKKRIKIHKMFYFKQHILKTSGQRKSLIFLPFFIIPQTARYRLTGCMDIAILC